MPVICADYTQNLTLAMESAPALGERPQLTGASSAVNACIGQTSDTYNITGVTVVYRSM